MIDEFDFIEDEPNMTRYLITGGGGFIGSHLAERLANENHDVIVIDNFCTGRRENIEGFADRITLHNLDLMETGDLPRIMEGVDYVFHQAALPSVPRSLENPIESHHANVTVTLKVLNAAKDAGVKRVVYAASSSAYGDVEVDYKHEGLPPNPLSPYGAAKLSGEYYCQAFYHSFGLETVSLRYFNVFGPRQNPYSAYTGVLAIFIPLMLKGERPTIFGDGSVTRDFTYVENNVEANLLAATADGAPGETMNIACGKRYSLVEIVDGINQALGTNIEPKFADPRPGDIKHSLASIEKAERILRYKPQVSFEEGLERTIAWYRDELVF